MQQVLVPTSSKHARKLVVRAALAMVVVLLVTIVLAGMALAIQARSGPERFAGREPEQGRYRCFSWHVFPPPGLCARTRHFPAQSESWDTTVDHCGKDKN